MLMPCLKDSQCARRARPSDAINTIFTLLLSATELSTNLGPCVHWLGCMYFDVVKTKSEYKA